MDDFALLEDHIASRFENLEGDSPIEAGKYELPDEIRKIRTAGTDHEFKLPHTKYRPSLETLKLIIEEFFKPFDCTISQAEVGFEGSIKIVKDRDYIALGNITFIGDSVFVTIHLMRDKWCYLERQAVEARS